MDKIRLLELAGVKVPETGHHTNIEKDTLNNKNFRKVLFTAKNTQLVVMSLKPGEDIGAEVHDDTTQFLRFEAGEGKVEIGGNEYNVKDGDSVIIPQGSKHNVTNTSDKDDLRLYSLYSPPVHEDGLVQKNKVED